MKTAEELLRILELQIYTARHIKIINDFIKSGEQDVKKLLDQLGGWDDDDLRRAEMWMRSDQSHPTTLPSDEESLKVIRTEIIKKHLHKESYVDGINVFFSYHQAMEEYASAKLAEMEREKPSLQDRLFTLANDFAVAKQGDIAVRLHSIHNSITTTP